MADGMERWDDRLTGALLGVAAGDALGVPYEYGARPLPEQPEQPVMLGGGLGDYAPGQWSDDTELTAVVARVAADGYDLRTEEALDRVADGFVAWYAGGPADVGDQTRAVLSGQRRGAGSAARLRERAADLHRRTGRTAGNGSLMRTAPVALAHLGDPAGIVDAARAVSALTHHDRDAGDACALWCLAIDHAIVESRVDAAARLSYLEDTVARYWGARLDEAARSGPGAYAATNGWVVAALQGAWAAISATGTTEDAIVAAVRGGGDTDTVAAIAGVLVGAAHGASSLPARWTARVHGWPGLSGADLADLARAAAAHGVGRVADASFYR